MIVVIAILGILAAIAIPRFTASRQNAERSSVEANLRTIDSAIMAYVAEQGSSANAPTAGDNGNLIPNYLAAWPTGPGTAEYAIQTTAASGNDPAQYRAVVSGDAGGATGMTNLTVEELPWNVTTP